jgi:putative ABC transport system ATP-binding protein
MVRAPLDRWCSRAPAHLAKDIGMIATATVQPPPSLAVARTVGAVKVYGKGDTTVRALDGVTVEFPSARFTAIMGPSGSGKSTLMHCLAGLDTLTSGSVQIAGTDLGTMSDRQLTKLRRDRLGFVFQAFNLVPTLTALENITLPMDLGGRKPDRAWLDQVIDTVGLRTRLSHRPSELSGGQQQRVAVARALASRPELIFADEPTGNLDSRTGAELLAFLQHAVRDLGQTIVMVTHDAAAASYADRVLFLADGQVVSMVHEPSADEIIDRMKVIGDAAAARQAASTGAGAGAGAAASSTVEGATR